MTDEPPQGDSATTWRLMTQADIPFVYELVTKVDPRWWRFSKHGLEPSTLIQVAATVAAGVVVEHLGEPVGAGTLHGSGGDGTGTFDLFAVPDPHAERIVASVAHELVAAAFSASMIRRLYHERFEGDPWLLGEAERLFETEVVFPEFASIDGRFEERSIRVATQERFVEWRAEVWPS